MYMHIWWMEVWGVWVQIAFESTQLCQHIILHLSSSARKPMKLGLLAGQEFSQALRKGIRKSMHGSGAGS